MKSDFSYHGPVVVFDLDDTLISEREFCETGFEVIERELLKRFPGQCYKGIAEKMTRLLRNREPYMPLLLMKVSPYGANELNDIMDIYGSHTEPAINPKPGVTGTLEELADRHIVCGVITDGRSKTQRAKLKSAGLLRFFAPDMIFISEETGHDKTSVSSFAEIVRLYPEAKRFLYVGDNPEKDIASPSLLGWETAILAYDNNNVHTRDANNVKKYVPTYNDIEFCDILKIIEKS